MSDETSDNGARERRKILSPEILPAPPSAGKLTPAERVAERSRSFLERFRGIGTAAGAALTLQCGYGVVDPLPPPPVSCNTVPDPFSRILAMASFTAGQDAGTPTVLLRLFTQPFSSSNYVGFSIDQVHVTGGTLVDVVDQSSSVDNGSTEFHITLALESESTTQMLVDVDFSCGAALASKHYSLRYQPPAVPNGSLITIETAIPDGGASP